MLAKMWKKVLLAVVILACLFNVVTKLVKKPSLEQELRSSAQYMQEQQEENAKQLAKYLKNKLNYDKISNSMFNETIKRGEYKMKEGLHPEYQEATITCACGNVMKTNSTKKDMKVDICSYCHPFWTGNIKRETTGGRADKFKKKYGIA